MIRNLNSRQRKLLLLVCGSGDIFYSADKMSKELLVTKRTIRNDIQQINDLLKHESLEIKVKKNVGYYLVGDSVHKKKVLNQFMFIEGTPIDAQERIFALFGCLIFERIQSIYTLINRLHISEYTLKKDVESLNNECKVLFNKLVIRFVKGRIKICLHENEIRVLFITIVYKKLQDENLVQSDKINLLFNHLFDINEYYKIKMDIANIYINNEYTIADDSLSRISLIIYFSWKRSKMMFTLKPNEVSLQDYYPDKVMEEIRNHLRVKLGFSVLDYNFINPYLYTVTTLRNQEYNVISYGETVELVEMFTSDVKKMYNVDFHQNIELVNSLLIHVDAMLQRIKMNKQLSNSMLHDIKKNYLYAYTIATLISPIIKREKSMIISEDEVSYIALYIETASKISRDKLHAILVCGSGMGIVHLVKQWIQINFSSELIVIDFVPVYKLKQYLETEKADLIITTVTLFDIESDNIVNISPLPSIEDYENIKRKVSLLSNKSFSLSFGVFSPNRIVFYEQQQSLESIIQAASKRFVRDNVIETHEDYCIDVLSREEIYPTLLFDGFLMPHPITTFGNKTCFDVTVLKQPILVHGSNVKLIFTMCIDGQYNPDLERVFDFIKYIGFNKSFYQRLIESTSAQSFMELLGDYNNKKNRKR